MVASPLQATSVSNRTRTLDDTRITLAHREAFSSGSILSSRQYRRAGAVLRSTCRQSCPAQPERPDRVLLPLRREGKGPCAAGRVKPNPIGRKSPDPDVNQANGLQITVGSTDFPRC